MRAHSQHCFQRHCRCRCKHLGLSAPMVTIRNLSGPIWISLNRLSHDTHVSHRIQLVLSLFLHVSGIVKDCQGVRLFGIVSTNICFQRTRLVAQECVHRWRAHVTVLRFFFCQFSFDRFVGNRGYALFLLTTSPSTAPSRKWLLVFPCAPHCYLSSTLEASSWCQMASFLLSWSSSPAGFAEGSSLSFSSTSRLAGGRARRSAAGGMSRVVDAGFCCVSTFAWEIFF